MNKGGYFSFHGGKLHNLVIFLIWQKMINRGLKTVVQDRSFKSLHNAPCIPDIRVITKKPNEMNYIIEVESKLTKDKAHKKWIQFVRETYGNDLILVDIDCIEDADSIKSIDKYLESVLP